MLQSLLKSALPPMASSPLQQLMLLSGANGSSGVSSLLAPAPQQQPSMDVLALALLLQSSLGSTGSNPLSSFEALLGLAGDKPKAAPKLKAAVAEEPSTPLVAEKPQSTGPVVIAQIDQFSTDGSGFNHGEAIAKELTDEGGVDLLKFDVSGGNTSAGIATSLESIIQKVKNGERIDAVNISQQDFSSSGDTERVKKAIEDLEALGVPVAVAAGNSGPDTKNQLAADNAFVVESSDKNTSGTGNVSGEGRTTSFATANLTPLLAKLKSQGLSIAEIRQQVS